MASTPSAVSTDATQIGELKHVSLVTRSLLKDVRLRHTSTKKMLKEDLLATMRELSDASSMCHYAENEVTQLNKYAASSRLRLCHNHSLTSPLSFSTGP